MELQGKVIYALEQRSGTSARGEWVSQDFVLETINETYPRKMVFSVFGADRLQRFAIQVGQIVNVSFDIDAREYNGRWYNSIRAFDVRQIQNTTPVGVPPMDADFSVPQATAAPAAAPVHPFAQPETSENVDDLPF